ncbi:MAG: hypothetical protein KatS3mg105_2256 [Gemmatales bacterium]|nr:MAG: hypothetical protein KatS3mg105_2256 [Gemmatales bacterium]
MFERIGETAGKIWHYLNAHGATTLTKLAKGINENERAVLLGIGWLAREDKLVFSTQGRSQVIGLK